MIHDSEITVVVQGEVRPNTITVLQGIRRTTPDARLLFSSFPSLVSPAQREALETLVDEWVWSPDPGPMRPTVRSVTAPHNNINRMLRSSQAGLSRVRTAYALKLRSDAQIDVRAVADLWSSAVAMAGGERRILVPSRYTRHPDGINGYLYHVSDWLGFAKTDTLRDYWQAPVFEEADACWFDTHAHPAGSTATARRFHARLTQEQWVTCHYAQRHGYPVPEFLDQRNTVLLAGYRAFLARECVVADSAQIGLVVPAHTWAEPSAFQRLDCVSHLDWCQQVQAHADPSGLKKSSMRRIARASRHGLARGLLIRKWIMSWLARRTHHRQVALGVKTTC